RAAPPGRPPASLWQARGAARAQDGTRDRLRGEPRAGARGGARDPPRPGHRGRGESARCRPRVQGERTSRRKAMTRTLNILAGAALAALPFLAQAADSRLAPAVSGFS